MILLELTVFYFLLILQLGKDKFHKSHCFDYRNDVTVYVGEHKSGIGKDCLLISINIGSPASAYSDFILSFLYQSIYFI